MAPIAQDQLQVGIIYGAYRLQPLKDSYLPMDLMRTHVISKILVKTSPLTIEANFQQIKNLDNVHLNN
jgi:hypothetical protein